VPFHAYPKKLYHKLRIEEKKTRTHLDTTKRTKAMSLHQAFAAEELTAVALAAAIFRRLAARAARFLAHETLATNEHP
jgi:hypothetical protein